MMWWNWNCTPGTGIDLSHAMMKVSLSLLFKTDHLLALTAPTAL